MVASQRAPLSLRVDFGRDRFAAPLLLGEIVARLLALLPMKRRSRDQSQTQHQVTPERFERWRATRQKRRIPEALWKVAAGLASEYGVHGTSRALRLNYDELKRHWSASAEGKAKTSAEAEASSFVPLMAPGLVGGQGAAEYKGVDGTWMRVTS